MKLILTPATTSVICHVFIPDSTSTSGAGKTALAFGDITAYYVRAGGALTALTMVDVTTLGTWDSDVTSDKLGLKKLDDTNAPGLYEVHLPDNILAAGANQVVIQMRATGAAPTMIEIQLVNVPANERAIMGTALTESSSGYLTAGFKKLFDVATPVLTAASVNQTGDAYSVVTNATYGNSAIKGYVDDIGTAGAGLTAVPWNSNWDAEVQSEVADELDTIMADSVATDGTRPTLRQAVYELIQFMTEKSVSSTTVTVKKVDGSTSLMTFTLDSATAPTSITRAS